MFQINRKEYTNMIDALGELQNVLETERATQRCMSDGSEGIFKGAAGMAMRAGLSKFLTQGVYEKAYQQCKKMKESMESLLPFVIKLLWEADTLATHLEEDVLTNSFIPYYVLYPQSNTEIFMLDETYVNSVEQGCEDLVRRGQLLKNQMHAAINKCAGIIDCSAEQAALDEAEKSVLRIANFQEAFQSYVVGVRDLDESLRLDFQMFAEKEVTDAGEALSKVISNEIVYIGKMESDNRVEGRLLLPKPGDTISISRGIDLPYENAVVFSWNTWSREYSVEECNTKYPNSLCCRRLNYAIENYECNSTDTDLLMFDLEDYDEVVFAGAMVEGYADIGDIVKVTLDNNDSFYFWILDVKSIQHTSHELALNNQCQCDWGHGYIIDEGVVQLSVCEFITAGSCDENNVQNTKSGAFLKHRSIMETQIVDHIQICD